MEPLVVRANCFDSSLCFCNFICLTPRHFILMTSLLKFQLTADTVTLELGPNVLLNVEEELRLELEPVQTLLLQMEELTV